MIFGQVWIFLNLGRCFLPSGHSREPVCWESGTRQGMLLLCPAYLHSPSMSDHLCLFLRSPQPLAILTGNTLCCNCLLWPCHIQLCSSILRTGTGTWYRNPPVHGASTDMKHQDTGHSCMCRTPRVMFSSVVLAVLSLVLVFMFIPLDAETYDTLNIQCSQ